MRITNSRIHQLFLPSLLYRTGSSSIHLTFDDGPHPVATPSVLNILRQRNIKATFFLLGTNALKYPELVREIVAGGHSIGNHSFDHPLMMFRSKSFVAGQLRRAEEAIGAATRNGSSTRAQGKLLFRPPFGFLDQWTAKLITQAGYTIIMWTVDPADFQAVEPSVILRRVLSKMTPGMIILLHDNERTSTRIPDLLNPLVDMLAEKGFSFAPLIA